MNFEEAKAAIGKKVLTYSMGNKMVRPNPNNWHGPYTLGQVTKGGLCIFSDFGWEDVRIPPSQLKLAP